MTNKIGERSNVVHYRTPVEDINVVDNKKESNEQKDSIKPQHYRKHPSSVQCIELTEHMSFCLGNALDCVCKADLKDTAIEDLEKAMWYIQREITLRKANLNKVRCEIL